jgi:hypothetical protein
VSHLAVILTLLTALAACAGYGLVWLRLLDQKAEGGREKADGAPGTVAGVDPFRYIVAVALGMGTLAYLVLAIGLAGWLTRPALGALTAIGVLLLALHLRGGQKAEGRRQKAEDGREPGIGVRGPRTDDQRPGTDDQRPETRDQRPETRDQRPETRDQRPETRDQRPFARWLPLAIVALLGLPALGTLMAALAPVDGLDWDSLSYHLAAPKIYLREGRIFHIAYDSHTNFPFTMEMLYTLGLAFGGTGGAKLFHWTAGWLTAVAVGVWAARVRIGDRPAPVWVGPVAAAAFACMPLVLWEMGTAYVDLGTALFQFLALAVLIDSIERGESGLRVRWEGAALAGILSGFALGTKYTALLQFGLLGLGLLWVLARAGGKERPAALTAALAFGALGLLAGSPWYVKNWLWVHNPVYPFYYGLFPGSFSWNRDFETAYYAEQKGFGTGRGLPELLKVFWNLGLKGRAFFIAGGNAVGDVVGSLGPLWAGLLPLGFWARGVGWRVWAMLAYSLASIAVWFLMSHQSRYLMPVFAPLAVAAAVILAALPSRPLRMAAGLFTALGLVLSVSLWAYSGQPILATYVVTGSVSEDDYKRQTLGSLHQAVRFVNTLPADVRVALYDEVRGYYFDRDYFWANPGQHDMVPYDRLRSGDELVDHLRRFRITHVLINFAYFEPGSGHTELPWYRLLKDAIREGRLREVFRTTGAELERRGIIVYEVR